MHSLAITQYATNPYMQLDLNTSRSDIASIRIVARADCCLSQSQNLNVYLSPTTNFMAGTLCRAGIVYGAVGGVATVLLSLIHI